MFTFDAPYRPGDCPCFAASPLRRQAGPLFLQATFPWSSRCKRQFSTTTKRRARPRRLNASLDILAGDGAAPSSVARSTGKEFVLRMRYRLEHLLARSPGWQLTLLASAVLLTLFASGLFYWKLIDRDQGHSMSRSLWNVWGVLSGNPGLVEQEKKKIGLIIVSIVSIAHFMLYAVLVSVVSEKIETRVNQLAVGYTKVYERGHYLILGWNENIFSIIKELAIAAEVSGRRQKIVILSTVDKTRMDEMLMQHIDSSSSSTLDIITRQGDPASLVAQQRVAAGYAGRVVILAQQPEVASEDASDAMALTTLLVNRQVGCRNPVIVESRTKKRQSTRELFTTVDPNVVLLNWREVVGRLGVILARAPKGLDKVLYQLMSFDKDEIYVRASEDFIGSTIEQVGKRFQTAVVLGYIDVNENAKLNPDPCYEVQAGDQVVLLAKDHDIELQPRAKTPAAKVCRRQTQSLRRSVSKEHIVIVGFRGGLGDILKQIDSPGRRGTMVTLISDIAQPNNREHLKAEVEQAISGSGLKHIRVKHIAGLLKDPKVLREATRRPPTSILVLMKDEPSSGFLEDSPRSLDSWAIASLVQLRNHLSDKKIPSPRVVVEVMDPDATELVEAALPSAEAVSRQGIFARLTAQATENPLVAKVWDILLSQDDENIVFLPPSTILPGGGHDRHRLLASRARPTRTDKVSFRKMSELAWRHGCTLIGFVYKDGSLSLNPARKEAAIDMDSVQSLVIIAKMSY